MYRIKQMKLEQYNGFSKLVRFIGYISDEPFFCFPSILIEPPDRKEIMSGRLVVTKLLSNVTGLRNDVTKAFFRHRFEAQFKKIDIGGTAYFPRIIQWYNN